MTNYERLKSASVEDLAALIAKIDSDIDFDVWHCRHCEYRTQAYGCDLPEPLPCSSMSHADCVAEWLNHEVEAKEK